jgi:hypothetical protein
MDVAFFMRGTLVLVDYSEALQAASRIFSVPGG